MPYQINSKKLFLTYPQCNLSKEYVADELIKRFSLTRYIVAHELHANGDDHLHAYLELSEPLRTRDPRFADIDQFHGNYQGCRSSKCVIKYCTKKDDYVGNIDVSSELSGSTRAADAEEIISGKTTLFELLQKRPHYLFGLTRLEQDLRTFERLRPDPRLPRPDNIPNTWQLILLGNQQIKQRHYWIWSSQPNKGKTTFAKNIIKNYRSTIKSDKEPYWNLNTNEEIIILDEYNSALFTYQQLNCMCDGTYSYRMFMAGTIQLDDPLIIVLSNRPIKDLYVNMYDLLYARFNEIELV